MKKKLFFILNSKTKIKTKAHYFEFKYERSTHRHTFFRSDYALRALGSDKLTADKT
jgi:hypothetical protein